MMRVSLCIRCEQPLHPAASRCPWCRTRSRVTVNIHVYRTLVTLAILRKLLTCIIIGVAVAHKAGVMLGVVAFVALLVLGRLFARSLPWM